MRDLGRDAARTEKTHQRTEKSRRCPRLRPPRCSSSGSSPRAPTAARAPWRSWACPSTRPGRRDGRPSERAEGGRLERGARAKGRGRNEARASGQRSRCEPLVRKSPSSLRHSCNYQESPDGYHWKPRWFQSRNSQLYAAKLYISESETCRNLACRFTRAPLDRHEFPCLYAKSAE